MLAQCCTVVSVCSVSTLATDPTVSVQEAQNELARSIRAAKRKVLLDVVRHEYVELVASQTASEGCVERLLREQSF